MYTDNTLKEIARLNREIKALNKELDVHKGDLKEHMINNGFDSLDEGGVKASLAKQSKTTVKREDLLLFLNKNNLMKYVVSSIEPNVEMLENAVGTDISEQDFKSYVKKTEFYRLTVK